MFLTMMLMAASVTVWGQNDSTAVEFSVPDTASERMLDPTLSDIITWSDSTDASNMSILSADTLPMKRQKRDWSTWKPNPKRALWLAIVLPGGGQIYNRKYWKLPIVYGGFVGCVYALQWNNQMYRDYSQAYIDIIQHIETEKTLGYDPTPRSYNQFLHLGNEINKSNQDRYKSLFKKRKDYYRRYRDLSFFVLIGVYALSVLDAYVDASLSDFDISKDLSMRVSPTVISNKNDRNPLKSSALGLQCSLRF